MPEAYRYRAELPRVVEAVHHRNALTALGARGILLADDATWYDICKYGDSIENSYSLTRTTYAGKVAVNGLFGELGWKLIGSTPTPYIKSLVRENGRLEDLHQHVKIHTRAISDDHNQVDIYMIPDAPPYAIRYNPTTVVELRRTAYTDAGTLEAAQRIGDDIFEFVDEETAGSIVHALRSDASHATFG